MIKKFVRRLMDRFLNDIVQLPEDVPANSRRRALNEFEALLGWIDSGVTPSLKFTGLTTIETTHPDLVSQMTYMKGLNQLIESNKAITFKELAYEMRATTLEKYLVTVDGEYVPVAKMRPFCEEGIKLCNLTEAGETAVSGVAESNLRVLGLFFEGCANVCRGLSALHQQE